MDTDRYIKIRGELEEIKGMIKDVSNQMQELREAIRGAPFSTQVLPVSQPYQHPWWQYQRPGSITGRNGIRRENETPGTVILDKTRSGVSGAA